MSKVKLAVVVAGLAAAGSVGVAFGLAAGNDTGTITACVDHEGSPRLVPAGTACKGKDTTVTWNVQGPAGPQGAQGAQGPKGDQGPAGVSGHTVTIIGNVAITGRNNTPIKGGPDGQKDKIDVISYSEGIVSPRDAASGLPTGKRMHKPFTITKEVDAATPLLMQACATNEVLPAVQFVLHPPGASADVVSVTLHNAECGEIEDSTSEEGTHELETITFTFQKITVENAAAKTMFEDDWTQTS
jgi:type VI secretion system secreted protein Hcp